MNTKLTITMSAAIALLATACSTAAGGGASTTVSSSVKGKQITFIGGDAGDSFYITMSCGIQAEAKKLGMTVNTQYPQQFQPSEQTPIVSAAVAKDPAAILIAPTDATAMYPPLLQARQAGITIGLVDTTLQNTSIAATSVSTDNTTAGAAAADALAKLIGGKGEVMVISFQVGASTSDERTQGFQQEIAKYHGITDLGAQVNNNDPATAASIVTATLAAHPHLAGIFATNQFAAQGAATGLRDAGKTGQVKVVGFDAGAVQVQQLKQGDVQALIAQKPYQIGIDAVEQTAAALTGKKVTKSIPSGTVTITQSNLNQPASQQALYKTSC
jgi:ribose transport system substrate-binding protein